MEMKQLGVGILGAGFMGHTHTYNYLNMPLFYDDPPVRIKLIGICDTDLNRAATPERHLRLFICHR